MIIVPFGGFKVSVKISSNWLTCLAKRDEALYCSAGSTWS